MTDILIHFIITKIQIIIKYVKTILTQPKIVDDKCFLNVKVT